jgi:hypothetical protein
LINLITNFNIAYFSFSEQFPKRLTKAFGGSGKLSVDAISAAIGMSVLAI